MNDLETLLARIKTFNAKAQTASDGMAALVNERQAILSDAAALGLKYRKTVPMLAAIGFDIVLPAGMAAAPAAGADATEAGEQAATTTRAAE